MVSIWSLISLIGDHFAVTFPLDEVLEAGLQPE